jgi:hypothetical protein
MREEHERDRSLGHESLIRSCDRQSFPRREIDDRINLVGLQVAR